MEVIQGINGKIPEKPLGIGLGNFDGLHIGHMVLINTLTDECRISGLGSMLYTFSCHPESVIRKKLVTPLIMNIDKKKELLDETHLDYLYLEEFDEGFSHIEPETFIRDVLVKRFNIRLAVAGFDYGFGYRGRGNVEMLKNYGKTFGFDVIIIPPVRLAREIVSSTLIRQYAKAGKMARITRMLGRHFSVSGIVLKGSGIGKTLGFPTANILPQEGMLIPADGVYITRMLVDGRMYHSVTNIGQNPTFKVGRTTVETHVLDMTGDLYGKNIEIFFEKRIRGEIRFASPQLLAEQINKDIAFTRRFFRDKRFGGTA